MKKINRIRLTESQMNRVLKGAINKVLNESGIIGDDDKFARLREMVGDAAILDELEQWMPQDKLEEFINDFIRLHDLEGEFQGDMEDDDYEL